MPDPEAFERYFHERAALAEELYTKGSRHEARLLAAVALDALAAIWAHDEHTRHDGSDLRLADFVQRFVNDDRSRRIAVVFFAEDMLRVGPARFADVAVRLLAARGVEFHRPQPMEFRGDPRAYLDTDWAALLTEEPELRSEPGLVGLARRYEYPALLYRLVRCAVAHSLTSGRRTSDFSSGLPDTEISYFPTWASESGPPRPNSIKFGLKAITDWVRAGATGYAAHCRQQHREPAVGFDANAESQSRLDRKWTVLP